MKRKKTVDVIVPTYKPGKDFEDLLHALDNQLYPIAHLMIMNTEEEYWDDKWEKDRPQLEVYHIKKEHFDHGGTRNEAAEMSMADILVFMTQDAIPRDENVIGNLVQSFEYENVKAAYARQLAKPGCDEIERYTRKFNYPAQSKLKTKADLPTMGIKTYFCSNVCAAYDRETYMELGGFVRHTIFNEDMIYAGNLIQAGYGVYYNAKACVFHSHNYNSIEQFHRNFDMAVSQADHPEVFSEVKSIGEGMKLVKNTAAYLIHMRQGLKVFQLITRSGFKFLGYAFGKRYKKLPMGLIRIFTSNRGYWQYEEEN